jgi:predicted DNA-binding transcriptional regulator AlpA
MNEYDFSLHFKLADNTTDPSIYEDRLFEAGCDDALLGIGQKGYIGLDFIRSSNSAIEAIYSAIENVKSVIPDSELYYISPDVVSISEIATIMNCTRQNILKLKNTHINTFPFPINSDGKSLNWHLAEVLKWYRSTGKSIDTSLLEVAEFAMQFNLEKQNKNINSDNNLKEKARALVC